MYSGITVILDMALSLKLWRRRNSAQFNSLTESELVHARTVETARLSWKHAHLHVLIY